MLQVVRCLNTFEGINVTITSIVLVVTTFGLIFYAFVIVAGAASMRCPYQTPGTWILPFFWKKLLSHFEKDPPLP